jgi:multicomponent Na+:H+ antiporter subunit F
MSEFLFTAASGVLAVVVLGLVRVLRGPGNVERMMAAQLLGSGGIAVLLLMASAYGVNAAADVALTLALLTAFASVAFVKSMPPADARTKPAESKE